MFQSTHPRRCDQAVQSPFASPSFNPRTHAGATLQDAVDLGIATVSIHAPTQVRRDHQTHQNPSNVSIHAPTQGATVSWPQPLVIHCVSIHAPTQGATDGGDRYYDSSDVSIHAPTQGATNGFSGHLASSCFNPRTHAGCDFVRLEHRAARVVSIHAPTQVRLRASPALPAAAGCFNPRTHAGATDLGIDRRDVGLSQSTHPRRVRRDHQADCELA